MALSGKPCGGREPPISTLRKGFRSIWLNIVGTIDIKFAPWPVSSEIELGLKVAKSEILVLA
jgi:hypothetical protein